MMAPAHKQVMTACRRELGKDEGAFRDEAVLRTTSLDDRRAIAMDDERKYRSAWKGRARRVSLQALIPVRGSPGPFGSLG
jgi:hypothetical protein